MNNTFDFLQKSLAQIPGIDNNWDRFLAPNFKGSFEDDQKRFLGIPSNEHIVYVRIIDADKTVPFSLAITDQGIYYRSLSKFLWFTVDDTKWSLKFTEFNEVKYSENEDRFLFSNGASIGRRNLVKKLDLKARYEFAKVLTKVAQASMGILDYFNRGIALMEEEKNCEALIELKKALELSNKDEEFSKSDERVYLYCSIGKCLIYLDEPEEAKSYLIIAKEIASNSTDSEIKEMMPPILCNLAMADNNSIESHKLLCKAIELTKSSEMRKDFLDMLTNLHSSENFHNTFVSLANLPERKVILVIENGQIPVSTPTIICLNRATIQEIGISFPIGHPIVGGVYIAHPTRVSHYIPANDYEETLFLEKVYEYCYLLQALKAKEIYIKSLRGKSLEEMKHSQTNVDVSFQNLTFQANGNMNFNKNNDSNSYQFYSFNSYQTFNPTGEPYVPSDLNWLAIESKWRRLIDNRLNNTLTEYVEEISTSENKILSTNEELHINMELKSLSVKLKGSLNIEDSISSSSKESTVWSISVKF